LAAAALLPPLFALYNIHEEWIWRGFGVLFALPMLSLQVTYPRQRRKVVGTAPPPAIVAVFVVLGSAVTLAMLGYVLVGLQYSAAAYITALTIDFFTVVFGFVSALDIIMQQPMDVPERPDLIEDQADEGLGPADVRRRHDEVERHRALGFDEIADAPVAALRDGGDDRVPIEAQKRHGRRQHPERSFSLLLRSSRAAPGTTGCTPFCPRCGVVIIVRSVVSIGRFGSERKLATPASVLSSSA
jgi:hypothetical protein